MLTKIQFNPVISLRKPVSFTSDPKPTETSVDIKKAAYKFAVARVIGSPDAMKEVLIEVRRDCKSTEEFLDVMDKMQTHLIKWCGGKTNNPALAAINLFRLTTTVKKYGFDKEKINPILDVLAKALTSLGELLPEGIYMAEFKHALNDDSQRGSIEEQYKSLYDKPNFSLGAYELPLELDA